jgi:hypothetical protein
VVQRATIRISSGKELVVSNGVFLECDSNCMYNKYYSVAAGQGLRARKTICFKMYTSSHGSN